MRGHGRGSGRGAQVKAAVDHYLEREEKLEVSRRSPSVAAATSYRCTHRHTIGMRTIGSVSAVEYLWHCSFPMRHGISA